jgi:uncharacterized membrane protein YjjB (DUF3815 family)
MNGPKQRRWLYVAIVMNLLLWMSVLTSVHVVGTNTKALAIAGFVLAALSQHWAYYALWKAPPDQRAIA